MINSSHEKTDVREIPDELWEHIAPLLAPFKRKNGDSSPLSQRIMLVGSFYNAGEDANRPCFPPVMAQKSLSTGTSSTETKPAPWRRDFSSRHETC